MEPKQLDILDNLEEATEKFIADFQKKVPSANKQILGELNDFLSTLKKRPDGTFIPSIENFKLIDKYYSTFDGIIQNTDYAGATRDFVKTFKESTSYMNDYFATTVVSFKNNKELYKQLIDANIDTTVDKLIGSGVDANFSYPIKELLKDNVKNGTNSIRMREALEKHIIGVEEKPGALVRYSKQVTSDSIHQFNANYFKSVSQDLGLNHYYYKGTKIDDSRPFCKDRAGRYFTEAEVFSWTDNHWAGEIPGTNRLNIFTNRGGYGCRHLIIPVSKEVYDNAKANGKAGLA